MGVFGVSSPVMIMSLAFAAANLDACHSHVVSCQPANFISPFYYKVYVANTAEKHQRLSNLTLAVSYMQNAATFLPVKLKIRRHVIGRKDLPQSFFRRVVRLVFILVRSVIRRDYLWLFDRQRQSNVPAVCTDCMQFLRMKNWIKQTTPRH